MGPHADAGVGASSTTKIAAPINHTMALNRTLHPTPAQAALDMVVEQLRAYVEYHRSTGAEFSPLPPAQPVAAGTRGAGAPAARPPAPPAPADSGPRAAPSSEDLFAAPAVRRAQTLEELR